MRPVRHLTPRYVANKVRDRFYRRRNPDAPWLTPRAIDLIDAFLQPDHAAFEWGAGKSTLWIARRVLHLTSVEDDPSWAARVSQWISDRGVQNVTLLRRARADGYADIDGEFDFVLVDGEAFRDQCALAALAHLRPGGMLVVDNANWYLPSGSHAPESLGWTAPAPQWVRFLELVSGWEHHWTSNGVGDTALWIKPAS